MRAMATRWRMPPDNWCGYLSASRDHVQPDLRDPFLGLLAARLPRHALAFQAEGDIVRDRPVVERGVILKDHTAVGARAFDGLTEDQHSARGRGKVRTQSGDKP